MKKFSYFFFAMLGFIFSHTALAELKYSTYNPTENAIFPVSSTIIYGEKDAILVDAQFSKNDAENLVKKIKELNKNLKLVFISHSDPDFYFGLDVIKKNFPNVKIVSTPETAYIINETKNKKLDVWKDALKENSPSELITPESISDKSIDLEGNEILIKQVKNDPDRSYLWVPSTETVLGGILVFNNLHIWLADTPSVQELNFWVSRINEISALKPKQVIAGHTISNDLSSPLALHFTKNYLLNAIKFINQSKNSVQLIDGLSKNYPDFQSSFTNLETSAKVIKGEMQWETVSSPKGKKAQKKNKIINKINTIEKLSSELF